MSSYGLTDDVRALRERMRKFINEEVIPAEPTALGRDLSEHDAALPGWPESECRTRSHWPANGGDGVGITPPV